MDMTNPDEVAIALRQLADLVERRIVWLTEVDMQHSALRPHFSIDGRVHYEEPIQRKVTLRLVGPASIFEEAGMNSSTNQLQIERDRPRSSLPRRER